MIIGISVAACAAVLAGIIVFILFHFGLVSCYHPMKKPENNQIRVACVGDSITYGCMVRNRKANAYPAVLNKLLGEKYCVNNFAYTNRTAVKDGDYPLTNEKVYGQSIDFKPDIVIVLLGTNDSKAVNWNEEKFVADYGAIIDGYYSPDRTPKIYVLLPPPLFEVRGKVLYKLRKDVVENEVLPAVKRIAMTRGLETINLHEVFAGKSQLFADGVHPNARGSRLLAQCVYEKIKK